MKCSRNSLWATLAGLAFSAFFGASALGQVWPTRPVKLIVISAPGGNADVAARLIAERLSKKFGKQFIVDNRPGAGGIVGVTLLKDSTPDGHTFGLVALSPIILTPLLFKNIPFDPERDLIPTAMVGISPIALVVKKDHPAKSLQDLLTASKDSGGKTALGTTLVNSVPYLISVAINHKTDARLNVVDFSKSTDELTSLLNGDVAATIDGLPAFEGMLAAGEVRALAVFSKERLPNRKTVPTASETLPGMVANGWFAFFAPKGTPDKIVELMHGAVQDVISIPEISERLLAAGIYPEPLSIPQLTKFLQDERKFWIDLVRMTGAKPQ